MISKRRVLASANRLPYYVVCLVFLVVAILMPIRIASAYSTDDFKSIIGKSWWYSQDSCGRTSVSTASNTTGTIKQLTASGSWSSGLSAPYTLEAFMIQVLMDIAAKEGVATTDVVTEQHVVALVAFAYGEGGNITNGDIYNPLNTGINNSSLVSGSNSASGLQSFKSFDAGVEGTAETMTTPNQDRLAATLINPNSTTTDFMHALTYYQQYPHNQLWAEASQPPHQDSYYSQRLQLVQQTIANYPQTAGLQLGPPGNTQTTLPIVTDHLVYHPGGSSSGSTSPTTTASQPATSCTTNANASSASSSPNAVGIVATAIKESWPTQAQGLSLRPKPEYSADICQFNKSFCQNGTADSTAADCGIFVATVMHASGADPHYPSAGTSNQANYVLKHPELYAIVAYQLKTTADLHPGDILILNAGSYRNSSGQWVIPGGAGASGHTMIWTGPQAATKTNEASASLGDRMPNLGTMGDYDLNHDPLNRGYYLVARLTKSLST